MLFKVNYGETLSTLLFASRCMAVKAAPVQHEIVDYAEMCAQLQAQLNAMDSNWTEKMLSQQQHYEDKISDLHAQVNRSNINYKSKF